MPNIKFSNQHELMSAKATLGIKEEALNQLLVDEGFATTEEFFTRYNETKNKFEALMAQGKKNTKVGNRLERDLNDYKNIKLLVDEIQDLQSSINTQESIVNEEITNANTILVIQELKRTIELKNSILQQYLDKEGFISEAIFLQEYETNDKKLAELVKGGRAETKAAKKIKEWLDEFADLRALIDQISKLTMDLNQAENDLSLSSNTEDKQEKEVVFHANLLQEELENSLKKLAELFEEEGFGTEDDFIQELTSKENELQQLIEKGKADSKRANGLRSNLNDLNEIKLLLDRITMLRDQLTKDNHHPNNEILSGSPITILNSDLSSIVQDAATQLASDSLENSLAIKVTTSIENTESVLLDEEVLAAGHVDANIDVVEVLPNQSPTVVDVKPFTLDLDISLQNPRDASTTQVEIQVERVAEIDILQEPKVILPLPTSILVELGHSLAEIQFKELHAKYFHIVTTMPDCVEKSISAMYAYFESEQKRKKISCPLEPFFPSENLFLIFNLLKNQMKFEGLLERRVRTMLDVIEKMLVINPLPLEELENATYKLLSMVQSINLDVMLYLIDQALKASEKIKDKDIILLLGGTGSGKSTTIHFLAGSKFEKKSVSGLKHITPVEVVNPDLKSFYTSPFSRSETRSINSVTLDSQLLGANSAREVTLCDSPGFGDTDGAELDIANGIGIVRAVKMSRSVKPVILVSQQSIGDRWEGLTKLANTLMMFIPNIEQHLESISYIFTKFSKDENEIIYQNLANKLNHLTREESSNKGFVALLKDMVKKTATEVIILDPINDKPGQLLDKLYTRAPILNPEKNFDDFATPDSLAKLKEQLYKHKVNIEKALESANIPLVIYKINQLAKVNKQLLIPDSQKMYAKCIEGVDKLIQTLQAEIERCLLICLNEGNNNIESEVTQCSLRMLDLYRLEPVREVYLTSLPHLQEICAMKVTHSQKNLFKQVQAFIQTYGDTTKKIMHSNLIALDKMLLFWKIYANTFSIFDKIPDFVDILKTTYDDALTSIKLQLNEALEHAEQSLAKYDFSNYVNSMDNLYLLKILYGRHLDPALISNKYQILYNKCNAIFTYLTAQFANLLTVQVAPLEINIESTQHLYEVIIDVSLIPGIEMHCSKDELNKAINDCEIILETFYTKVNDEVICQLWDEYNINSFNRLYAILLQLDKLRECKKIEYPTSKYYFEIVKQIKRYISKLNEDAQHYLKLLNESLLGTSLPINYEVIENSVAGLINAKVFESHPENIIMDELNELRALLKHFLDTTETFFMSCNLTHQSASEFTRLMILFTQVKHLIKVDSLLFGEPLQSEALLKTFEMKVLSTHEAIYQLLILDSSFLNTLLLTNIFNMYSLSNHPSFPQLSESANNYLSKIKAYSDNWFNDLQAKMNQIHNNFLLENGVNESELKLSIEFLVDTLTMFYERLKYYRQNLLELKNESSMGIMQEILDAHPTTIFNEWINSDKAKLILHISTMLDYVEKVESGQGDDKIHIRIKTIHALRALDKFLPNDCNYASVLSKFDLAICTLNLTRINELKLLISAGKFLEFSQLYQKISLANPELSEQLIVLSQEMMVSILEQTDRSESKINKLDLTETNVELFKMAVLEFASLKQAYNILNDIVIKNDNHARVKLNSIEASLINKLISYQDLLKQDIAELKFVRAEIRLRAICTICELQSDFAIEVMEDEFKQKLRLMSKEARDAISDKIEEQSEYFCKLSLTDYTQHPPLFFYNQMIEAVTYEEVYKHKIEALKTAIIDKIQIALQYSLKEEATIEDIQIARSIAEISHCIPAEIHNLFSTQLKEVLEQIELRERKLQEELSAGKLTELVDKLSYVTKMKDIRSAHIISGAIHGIIRQSANRFQNDLEKGDLAIVTNSLPMTWEDWWYYGDKLNELAQLVGENHAGLFSRKFIDKTITDMMINITNKYAEVIDQIHQSINRRELSCYRLLKTHIDKIISLFALIITYKDFKSKRPMDLHFFDDLLKVMPSLNKDAISIIEQICAFIQFTQNKFNVGLEGYHLSAQREILDISHENYILFKKIDEFLNCKDVKKIFPDIFAKMSSCMPYEVMKQKLSARLIDIKNKILVGFLHNKDLTTADFDAKDNFYRSVSGAYQAMSSINLLTVHIDEKMFDIKSTEIECKEHIVNQLKMLNNELLVLTARFPYEDKEKYDQFNIWLDNLRSFRDNFAVASFVQEAEILLKSIERSFEDKVKSLKDEILLLADVEEVIQQLISLKIMAISIPRYLKKVNQEIDSILLNISKGKNGQQKIATMGLLLRKIEGEKQDSAIRLINEHVAFEGYAIALRNQKTLRYNSENVLTDLKGTSIDQKTLERAIKEYERIYWELVDNGLTKLEEAKRQIVQQAHEIVNSTMNYIDQITQLSAHLFAYWTLDNSSSFLNLINTADEVAIVETDNAQAEYLLQPHPAQVISIFRLLGVDVTGTSKLNNHLVQIGTGEGKSVTLAITASILAILNFEVDCACYSEYLSQRDYNAFVSIFRAFKIADHIHYGTFNKLCEEFINRRGDVREWIVSLITQQPVNHNKQNDLRKRILLIDEVDVFFGNDFYGNFYRPLAELRDKAIIDLIQYIWNVRHDKNALAFSNLKLTVEYKRCIGNYKEWDFLIEEAVKELISDVQTFDSHEYVVLRDKIGYKEQDGISYDISYGYKTLFAYFNEHAAGKITQSSRDAKIAITIDCGIYSYAEIPRHYHAIMGVTGTLETLSVPEKEILRSYGIEKFTYMPSVYGRNQLEFAGNSIRDVVIESNTGYLTAITNEINHRLEGKAGVKRAVLVFFENKILLDEFYECKALEDSGIKSKVKLITEQVSNEDKEGLVAQAVSVGSITLLTRDFGRGTDFKCYDDRLNASGGVHVIQTFISDSLSEEAQIKGRTARQGNVGSFSMVLLANRLERIGINEADINQMLSTNQLYDTINQKRCIFFEKSFPENFRHLEEIKVEHQASERFLVEALFPRNIDAVKAFLKARGELSLKRKVDGTHRVTRTLCLMDATGSMGDLIEKSKNTVHTMFLRVCDILNQKRNLSTFELQFVLFRNYDCREETLLQHSGWESDPANLRQFMNTAHAHSGTWEPEAVEIGLWYANHLADAIQRDEPALNQVILIGDAPPNPRELVIEGREKFHGENYWKTTRFAKPTYADDEARLLASKKIPVHAFYVKSSAQASFMEIAKVTGGQSEFLDINSLVGADKLTKLVCERVLDGIGGTELVEMYRHKYVKGYVSNILGKNSASLFANVNQNANNSQADVSFPNANFNYTKNGV